MKATGALSNEQAYLLSPDVSVKTEKIVYSDNDRTVNQIPYETVELTPTKGFILPNKSEDNLSPPPSTIDYSSDTSFFDEDEVAVTLVPWKFTLYKKIGNMHVFCEWARKTKIYRFAVIGPGWWCAMVIYALLLGLCGYVNNYLLKSLSAKIIFHLLFGVSIIGHTITFLIDPGLLRKYHHARSRHWSYCDNCESFCPPNAVHCSACDVCVMHYDHHTPVGSP